MKDRFGRTIDYMRISITDKCNLRCRYCMPEGVELLPMTDLLTFEEMVEVCTAAASLGVRKLKVTGGEPLVRRGAPALIRMLRQIPGIDEVTMTTNGVLLKPHLQELWDNGLRNVNISLDTRDRETYVRITGQDGLVSVLEGMEAALNMGMKVKINTVLLDGCNENAWAEMAELARSYPVDVRFIEMMPIGAGREFRGVSNEKLLEKITERYGVPQTDHTRHGNGPAVYYRLPGFSGSVGFISAIHGKFCEGCNRIRMSATGELKPCLCFGDVVDVRAALRQNYADDGERKNALCRVLEEAILQKPRAHCFEKKDEITENKKMIAIGG